MKFLARKTLGGFAPEDTAGEEYLRKIKLNDLLMVEVKRPRNGRHHRLYWALMNLVADNQEHYENAEAVHQAIKLATGHYTIVRGASGAEYHVGKKTSYEAMDQAEFSAYYERVCDVIAREFLPGVSSTQLKAEVEQMIGMAA